MKHLSAFLAAALLSTAALPALAKVEVGQPAPAFSLADSNGKTRTLEEFKGKTVVLEWTNAECPFVKKHYGSGNMQAQQKEATAAGVVWLSINSGAPGKQGAVDGAGANAIVKTGNAAPTAYLLDPEGATGKAYGAKTTPHMYVIDGQGVLRYMGGIDSIQSADAADIPKATQYVKQALAELGSGKAVSVPVSQPYGCSVKYGS
ncbi:thioredoxin family protein [Tahibacter harae]|uniref:Thioredoxin family protein n=1 Tax=Tahibacter harae TaxID=2963937 RepID=A0ABT1QUL3_9GAMM|nr:thioredoxin family protein [Tahibacter harae]MCQ4165979.1 thioredoxin family protein [Tahibacter harae]